MDIKNTPIFYYDEEASKSAKTPTLIALTELQQAVLFDTIMEQHARENELLMLSGRVLTTYHPSIAESQENHKFTHYVYALNDKYVNILLRCISEYAWNTTDTLEWNDEYQLVFNNCDRSSESLQGLLNKVVDRYVAAHGDPRPALNEKRVTEVSKQKMISLKHGGKLPADE